MLAAAKYLGAGLACSGLIGAGAGIGLIFSSLMLQQLETLKSEDNYLVSQS